MGPGAVEVLRRIRRELIMVKSSRAGEQPPASIAVDWSRIGTRDVKKGCDVGPLLWGNGGPDTDGPIPPPVRLPLSA